MQDIFSEGYGFMPHVVLFDQSVSPFAKLLYCFISSLCAERGYSWATNKYLAGRLNSSQRNVSRGLAELLAYVEIKDGKSGRRIVRVLGGCKPGQKRLGNVDKNVYVGGLNHDKNVQQNSISINNIKNNPDFLRKSGKSKKSKNMDDDVNFNIDPESGEEITHTKWGRPLNNSKLIKSKGEGKNKTATRIAHKFVEVCYEKVGVKPVLNFASYRICLFAINSGGLTEEQVYDLFDEWFGMGKPDEESVQITRALSTNQINGYKARNQIN